MEKLLREILAELKQINSGAIISGNDLCALLERNSAVTDDRVKSIYKEAFGIYKGAKEEKPEVKEYTLQEVVDKLYSVIETRRNSTDLLRIGDAVIYRNQIKFIANIGLYGNTSKVRATIGLDNGSEINVNINLEWLMNLKF